MPVALQGFPVGANRYLPYGDVALFNVECVDFAISVLRLGNGAGLVMMIFKGFLLSLIALGGHRFYGTVNGSSGNLCSIVRNIANALSDVADKCERIKAWHYCVLLIICLTSGNFKPIINLKIIINVPSRKKSINSHFLFDNKTFVVEQIRILQNSVHLSGIECGTKDTAHNRNRLRNHIFR